MNNTTIIQFIMIIKFIIVLDACDAEFPEPPLKLVLRRLGLAQL